MKQKKEEDSKPDLERIKTGIKGFDQYVEGGFLKNSSILLSGPPGAGKTIFALEFIYHGAAEFGETGLYVTFEESDDAMRRMAKRMGFNIDELEKAGKITFLRIPIDRPNFPVIKEIVKAAQKIKAQRVAIDSISIFSINSSMYDLSYEVEGKKFYSYYGKDQVESDKEYLPLVERKEQSVFTFTSRIEELIPCTLLMIADPKEPTAQVGQVSNFGTKDGVSEYICDNFVVLHYSGIGGAYDRALQILKSRSTNQRRGVMPLKITGKGIEVLERVDLRDERE